MARVTDVHIERIADDKYSVKLVNSSTNDLGEMTQMQLFAYLKARPLLDVTAEEVIDNLKVGDQITVQFQGVL